jgi:ssDNA-binding Zn-finger/Zn-ribbon topoisomerase 1
MSGKKLKKVKCPYCKAECLLQDDTTVYNITYYTKVWVCSNYPECDSYVGANKKTNEPLGRPANRELRLWKKNAHNVFDRLWKSGLATRTGAYKWLSRKLGISLEKCHIGLFDVVTCKKVVRIIQNEFQ